MFIAEIIGQFLLFFGIYYFADCFYSSMNIQNLILGGLGIFLYAVCTGISRKKIGKLMLFVLTHLALAVVCILCMVSGLWSGVLAVILFVQVLYSFGAGVSKGRIGLGPWGYAQAVLLALLYLADKLFYEKPSTNGLWG